MVTVGMGFETTKISPTERRRAETYWDMHLGSIPNWPVNSTIVLGDEALRVIKALDGEEELMIETGEGGYIPYVKEYYKAAFITSIEMYKHYMDKRELTATQAGFNIRPIIPQDLGLKSFRRSIKPGVITRWNDHDTHLTPGWRYPMTKCYTYVDNTDQYMVFIVGFHEYSDPEVITEIHVDLDNTLQPVIYCDQLRRNPIVSVQWLERPFLLTWLRPFTIGLKSEFGGDYDLVPIGMTIRLGVNNLGIGEPEMPVSIS